MPDQTIADEIKATLAAMREAPGVLLKDGPELQRLLDLLVWLANVPLGELTFPRAVEPSASAPALESRPGMADFVQALRSAQAGGLAQHAVLPGLEMLLTLLQQPLGQFVAPESPTLRRQRMQLVARAATTGE